MYLPKMYLSSDCAVKVTLSIIMKRDHILIFGLLNCTRPVPESGLSVRRLDIGWRAVCRKSLKILVNYLVRITCSIFVSTTYSIQGWCMDY